MIISPNGARVLSRLGFSFDKARAVEIDKWGVVRGDTQEPIISVDFSTAKEKFGEAVWAVHRVDLHNELLRLAMNTTEPGHPIRLRLSSGVVDASATGSITLQDGSKHNADLVIAADGLHSVLRSIVNHDSTESTPTGLSAFRFLIDTKLLRDLSHVSATMDKGNQQATLLADVDETTKERHIVWYPCRKCVTALFCKTNPC